MPLFEALNWAASLDEKLGYLDVPIAKGLRWVRDLVHHQLADALEPHDVPLGRAIRAVGHSQMISPAVVTIWLWRPIERLPDPGKKKLRMRHEPEQRKAYKAELAGRMAEEPLERFLDDLRPLIA